MLAFVFLSYTACVSEWGSLNTCCWLKFILVCLDSHYDPVCLRGFFFFFYLDLGLPCSCHLDGSSRICNFLETKEVYGLCRRKDRALTSSGSYMAAAWFFLRRLSGRNVGKTRHPPPGQLVAGDLTDSQAFLWILWGPFAWVIFQT